MKRSAFAAIFVAAFSSLALAAEPVGTDRMLNEFEAGSISVEEGLANWQLFYEVASHPRCANCHVGADNRPMWSGPSYGRTRPHGMNINAGESRIGAETLLCSTCHTDMEGMEAVSNDTPHAAPRVAMTWQLARRWRPSGSGSRPPISASSSRIPRATASARSGRWLCIWITI